jgi:hypothetical protein
MKKKIIGIFVCMLMIATAIPAVESLENSARTLTDPPISLAVMVITHENPKDGAVNIPFTTSGVAAYVETAGTFYWQIGGDYITTTPWPQSCAGSDWIYTNFNVNLLPENTTINWWVYLSNGIINQAVYYFSFSTGYTSTINDLNPEDNSPPVLGIPNPPNGATNQPVDLTWSIPIDDPDGDMVSWSIQCSNAQAASGTGQTLGTFSLALSGLAYSTMYTVWVNATDGYVYTRGSYTFTTEASINYGPSIPEITGPASGNISTAYDYYFIAIDPEGDQVYYWIDWGDNTSSEWIGPIPSGVQIIQPHTWATKGTYTIKAKARDIDDPLHESDWGTLVVTMPVEINTPFQLLLEKLFERFPNAFPLLRQLLGY